MENNNRLVQETNQNTLLRLVKDSALEIYSNECSSLPEPECSHLGGQYTLLTIPNPMR
jgi:hypothetical protein